MKKGKIILVEDDDILSKVLYEELKDEGYEVYQAFDGVEGLEMVQKIHPNLVLLDLLMPKMHGFDVLKELKGSPATNTIPVIILTMLGRDEDIKKGLDLGAEDYIVKAQHAVAEIIEKVESFFSLEKKPGAPEAQ